MKKTEEGLVDNGNKIVCGSLDLSCSFKERLAFLFTGHAPERIKAAITQVTNDSYDLGAYDYHSEDLAIRREHYHTKIAKRRAEMAEEKDDPSIDFPPEPNDPVESEHLAI